MQVLSLAPEQINSLAEPERAAINQLVCALFFFPFFMRKVSDPPRPNREAGLWVLLVKKRASVFFKIYRTLYLKLVILTCSHFTSIIWYIFLFFEVNVTRLILMLALTRFQSFLTSNHCLRLSFCRLSTPYRCTYSKAT